MFIQATGSAITSEPRIISNTEYVLSLILNIKYTIFKFIYKRIFIYKNKCVCSRSPTLGDFLLVLFPSYLWNWAIDHYYSFPRSTEFSKG